jgi:hypothetical protein
MTFVKAENTVLVSGTPIVEELVCEVSANCFPRRLVKKGSNDYQFEVCGEADNPIGILDVSYKRGIGDEYKADDAANVLQGPCVVVAETGDTSGNINKGDKLIMAANGLVKTAPDPSLNTKYVVGIAAETVTCGPTPLPILVRLLCIFMTLMVFGIHKKGGTG